MCLCVISRSYDPYSWHHRYFLTNTPSKNGNFSVLHGIPKRRLKNLKTLSILMLQQWNFVNFLKILHISLLIKFDDVTMFLSIFYRPEYEKLKKHRFWVVLSHNMQSKHCHKSTVFYRVEFAALEILSQFELLFTRKWLLKFENWYK